ncbi:MORN repeat variant [Pseudomonas chlororaphis]
MSEIEYGEDGLYRLGNAPFSGVAYSMENGFRDVEISYLDGMRFGPTREWYKPGTLALEEMYYRDALHGRARSWHDNGQIAKEGKYEYGIAIWEKSWDEIGSLQESYLLKEGSSEYKLLQRLRDLHNQKE